MKNIWWIGLLVALPAVAQIPRNSSGLLEYTHDIQVNASTNAGLKERARTFFNQPFLVHWTSVSADSVSGTLVTGKGYLDIHIKNHYSSKRAIPVLLQLSIEVRGNSYRYIINHFTVNFKNAGLVFPLEEKPAAVESTTYDRLLKKTHERMGFIIDWLKRHMGNVQN